MKKDIIIRIEEELNFEILSAIKGINRQENVSSLF